MSDFITLRRVYTACQLHVSFSLQMPKYNWLGKAMHKYFLFVVLVVIVVSFVTALTAQGENTNVKLESAIFAGGCFWKTQYVFSKLPGVVRTQVGYCGGNLSQPTYEQVCSGKTGHAESVLVEYDPTKTSYHQLLEVFFSSHDPTTKNRQGPDIGEQYRSVIFYTTQEQKDEALQYKAQLEQSHRFKALVVTVIEPAKPFYPAEEYHQNYYVKHGAVCY